MATSHELGQRFSRAFAISHLTASGDKKHCWTTSWGSSTRMMGGLIMCHGDDFGLVLPPLLAPIQAVVVVAKDTEGSVTRAAAAVVGELDRRGVRVTLDDNVDQGFGWRATEWDLQGVPIRVEIGPRDLAADAAVLYRRDTRDRATVPLCDIVDEVGGLIQRIQSDMLDAATVRRDGFIADCTTLEQVRDAAKRGVARAPWAVVGVAGEERLAADGITVRCLQNGDGTLPGIDDIPDAIAYLARAY
jgi:prolyl-tRNA synthetase